MEIKIFSSRFAFELAAKRPVMSRNLNCTGGVMRVDERSIRESLKNCLIEESAQSHKPLLIEEMPVKNGHSRIDLVAIGESLHGFEIKSDRDSVRRLVHQVDQYGSILDFAELVVGEKLIQKATEFIPDWWGLRLAMPNNGCIKIQVIRKPQKNPGPDPYSISQLLWRCESLSLLSEYIPTSDYSKLRKRIIHEALAKVVPFPLLRMRVIDSLKRRRGWPVDPQPQLYGGLFQPV